jgi:hypothetical protein
MREHGGSIVRQLILNEIARPLPSCRGQPTVQCMRDFYLPALGGTGTQDNSFRPNFNRTSDRTRRLRHCRQTIRARTLPTRASVPKRAIISSKSTSERCQQFRHSKTSEPRSTTRRSVHLSTSRSFKSISAMCRHLACSLFVLKG